MKRLAILGSTGSIGQQTLDIVRSFPDKFTIIALTAGANVHLLEQQAAEFHPHYISIQSDDEMIPHIKHLSLEEIACHPEIDLVVIATAGKVSLVPALTAIRAGKNIALANKEVMVMAGELITSEAKKHNVEIYPIDSEHSAIWQCLQGENRHEIKRLILTASGGPFRTLSLEELARVTAEDALKHPTWLMGPKVTIDSSTLMNKGLEVIEARWLFDVPYDRIKVVIHPESFIHAMVEFNDGSIKAQMSYPDMRLPIQYALIYPERWANSRLPRLDFDMISNLHFGPVDSTRFPCLKLAIEAGRKGGTYPVVLSAADEIAVSLFLLGQIGFADIIRLLDNVINKHQSIENPSLEEILAVDEWAREEALRVF